ncbi:hypothetical protein GQ44DRAFT_739700 [Phaeosphaeriaceae sp. PMI808]|nr:hypothetical protein GQ44DRAFT_739700 [Phaeosphaeriaceae sp. PMI808]
MSTAQGTASPRAPRGKHHSAQSATAQAPQNNNNNNNNAKSGQRRPKGNRAQHANNQHIHSNASPSRRPPALAESAVFPGEEAQLPNVSRYPKNHNRSQPSIDRTLSGTGGLTYLTDTESAPNAGSATPAKNEGAYAGPTFHASPAPSALPIPKFLSRSVPAKADSSDSTSSPSPLGASPSRAPIPVPRRNEDSPLDVFFKADRAERAHNANGSPASANFFNPVNHMPHHYKQDSYGSLNAPFPIELDGESRRTHMSPPVASPMALRSVTDPNQVPQLKDVSPPQNNDVMQDLFTRLSMSQQKLSASTPPRPDAFVSTNNQPHNGTPSPFHDGRSTVRSASGPSTPTPANQEPADFFYGNRNLSPLFKAAKHDPSKRNSGLRTEITADSPLIAQGMFQDFPPITSPGAMIPNSLPRNYPVGGGEAPAGPRRGSVPYIQPYREPQNNRTRTPGRKSQQPRSEFYPSKNNPSGPGMKSNRAGAAGAPASVKKPATSMMSFVPASVAAKQHTSSTPPSTAAPAQMKASTPPDALTLEQDLKRLLNLKMTGGAPSVR